MLRRMIGPLARAGWLEISLDEWYDDDDDETAESARAVEVVAELERSGFHLVVSWDSVRRELVVDDRVDGGGWIGVLPSLFPLDDALVVDLSDTRSPQACAETARRAFAAAGLLDTTRIRVPDAASSLRADLVLLLMAEHIYDIAKQHRGSDDAGEVFGSLGEDFSWRISSGIRAYPLIVPAVVPSAAARGIAEWCWRRESVVEEWHGKVGDLTMARANIAATRVVLPHVYLEGVDWSAVRVALTLPRRRLGDGRVLADLFEEGWEPILASVHRQVDLWQRADDELGPQTVLRLLAMHGSRTESVGTWWGSGHYETLTRQAIEYAESQGTLPSAASEEFSDVVQFADALAHHPDALDDDILRWLNQAVRDEQRRRHPIGELDGPALTLPDWAVEQLSELLADDDGPSDVSTTRRNHEVPCEKTSTMSPSDSAR
ncbi:hypothetical protein [Umezawaea sp. Da 62-37]|uniref:hypothetical protein n=1 Tax=Umezawaea sp. Da 62-37 TaxID=3075927 RepID=UPI0028F6C301|nr:hypothetical protein [Umezawaea sp. Da 62-37]WNV84868.1 hypothetical protein RM788_43035 [Umezawaea sp. Da 62-37]